LVHFVSQIQYSLAAHALGNPCTSSGFTLNLLIRITGPIFFLPFAWRVLFSHPFQLALPRPDVARYDFSI
ncbi:MAG TPA: hypothetical protein VE076_06190, partial [Nitrososphaeraceae archaeon]|nr:hypothetical protein [Nitrososphaeraceae archaeon]